MGGIWFWLLVLGELVFLYNCMGLEKTKGHFATASLTLLLTVFVCFGNLNAWLSDKLGLGFFVYGLIIAASYALIGVWWSFFVMWPRWGCKRKQMHKKRLTEWLEDQGIRGGNCPEDLKKELNLVVFGNSNQAGLETYISRVKDDFKISKKITNPHHEVSAEFKDELLNTAAILDPEVIADRKLRVSVSDLRREWLKTQNVPTSEVGIVIPERLIERFKDRITTPYKLRTGDPFWASVAKEPLFRDNKGKLTTWAFWWPSSMLWYGIHDRCHELWLKTIDLFETVGQRLMHKQYKDVRSDFEPAPPK